MAQGVHFFLAGQMADKEVFGLRQQVGVDGGGRLGCIGNADVKLRPFFRKPRIHMRHGGVLQGEDGVRLFKINLHITPLQSIQFELVFLLCISCKLLFINDLREFFKVNQAA